MIGMKRALLLALPLFAACASAPEVRPTAPALPPGTWVELRFDWPPGLAAVVETEHVRTETAPAGEERARLRLRSRLETAADDGGLAVRWRDVRHELSGGPTPAGVELLAEELATPDLRVTAAGRLAAVEPREEARAELAKALVALSHVVPVPESFRQRLVGHFQPDELRAGAAEDWDRLVGFWAGASLEAGRTYAARDLVPLDLLADLPVEVERRMRVVDRVSCRPEETEPRCVVLELVALADEEATSGLAPFLSRLFGDRGGPPRLAFEERTLLVTEPEGLRPHRLETTRRVSVSFGGDGAESRARIDERTVIFDYAASTRASPEGRSLLRR